MNLWKSLSEKGKYSTIIGFVLGVITTGIFTWYLVKNKDFIYLPFVLGWGFSITFFILPSEVKVKAKDFELDIKD